MKKVLYVLVVWMVMSVSAIAGTMHSESISVTATTEGVTADIGRYHQISTLCIVNTGSTALYFKYNVEGSDVPTDGAYIDGGQSWCADTISGLTKIGFKTLSGTTTVHIFVAAYNQ